jgi:hypothetical protein
MSIHLLGCFNITLILILLQPTFPRRSTTRFPPWEALTLVSATVTETAAAPESEFPESIHIMSSFSILKLIFVGRAFQIPNGRDAQLNGVPPEWNDVFSSFRC